MSNSTAKKHDPRKNADDAYEAFMSMPDSEWYGLVMSLVNGGVLEVEENKGFERAMKSRARNKPKNAMITEQAASTSLVRPQIIHTKEYILARTQGVMDIVVKGVDDKAGLEIAYRKRLELSKIGSGIENEREADKKYWLEGGRAVDADAKEKKALLAPFLEHLISQETAIANEKVRIAKIKEDEKKDARLRRLESLGWTEELWAVADEYLRSAPESEFDTFCGQMVTRVADKKLADEARAKQEAEAKAETERMRLQKEELDKREQEQKAESARLQKIQDDIAEHHRKQQQAEQERHDKIEREEQQKRDAEAEAQRQADRAAQLRRAQEEAAEKARVETEQRIAREAQEKADRERAEQAERDRQAAQRPDKDKLLAVADAVSAIKVPEGISKELRPVFDRICDILMKAQSDIRAAVNGAK